MISFLKNLLKRFTESLHPSRKVRDMENQLALLSLKTYTLEKYVAEQSRLLSELAQTQNDLAKSQNELITLLSTSVPSFESLQDTSFYDKLSLMFWDDDDDFIN